MLLLLVLSPITRINQAPVVVSSVRELIIFAQDSLTDIVYFVPLYDVRQIKVSGYDSHLKKQKKNHQNTFYTLLSRQCRAYNRVNKSSKSHILGVSLN